MKGSGAVSDGEPIFLQSDAGESAGSRAAWIPRAVRAGAIGDELVSMSMTSGGGRSESFEGGVLSGAGGDGALSEVVEAMLPSVITPSKQVRSTGVYCRP